MNPDCFFLPLLPPGPTHPASHLDLLPVCLLLQKNRLLSDNMSLAHVDLGLRFPSVLHLSSSYTLSASSCVGFFELREEGFDGDIPVRTK